MLFGGVHVGVLRSDDEGAEFVDVVTSGNVGREAFQFFALSLLEELLMSFPCPSLGSHHHAIVSSSRGVCCPLVQSLLPFSIVSSPSSLVSRVSRHALHVAVLRLHLSSTEP